jgi:hypothetical protein
VSERGLTSIHTERPQPSGARESWIALSVDGTVSAVMLAAVVMLLTLSRECSVLPATAVYRIYDADNTAPARPFLASGYDAGNDGQPGSGKPGRWMRVTPPNYEPLQDFSSFIAQLNGLADDQVRVRKSWVVMSCAVSRYGQKDEFCTLFS